MRKMSLITGIVFAVLFILIFVLVNYNTVYSWDKAAFNFINTGLHFQLLDGFFIAVTTYGRTFFWVPVVALLWLFGGKKGKNAATIMAIAFIFVIIVGLTLKDVYYRPRPFLSILNAIVLIPKPSDSSFPSGHAMIVAAGAAVSFLMLKKRYSIPLGIEAALVMFSRVYIGVHYPTDIIGGMFLGAAISLVTYSLLVDSKLYKKFFELITGVYSKVLSTIGIKNA